MQPVINNHNDHKVTPAQQNISRNSAALPLPVKATSNSNRLNLPEDFVSLSSDRSHTPDYPLKKTPSIPVSSIERNALRDSFSVYA